MSLRLIEANAPPPLPTLNFVKELRRPGELHETVALDAGQAQALAASASAAGIGPSTLLTLLVEAELLVVTLARLGLARYCAELAAGKAAPGRALSAAEAQYLRALTIGRERGRRVPKIRRVALPVRLLARLNGELLARALASDSERALAWEIRALLAGSTLGEWGLGRTLALTGAGAGD